MKLLNSIRSAFEQRAKEPSWDALADTQANTAGQHVDARSAEGIVAVYACVQAISESVSTLPLHVYRRTDTGDRERADDHWLGRLLDKPNDWQSGQEFRESQTAAILLHGNCYARKELNGRGEVIALHPLHPQRVTIVRLPSGNYRYDYTDESDRLVSLLADEVMHLRDRTDPGSIIGKSRIRVARDTLGLSLALRQHGANVFSRGARPAAVITNEGTRDLNTEQIRDMQSRLNQFASPANAGKVMQLPRGMKWNTVGLSNEDAEWLTAMQFDTSEIARLFRVPPTLIQDLTHATYSNVTELSIHFVRYSLARWIGLWESGVSLSLLGSIARQRVYAEHAVDGLLRGNSEARASYYQSMIASGVMTVNECRKLENLPAIDAATTLQPE